MTCTSRYLSSEDYFAWKYKTEFKRLKTLERVEKLMYKEMLEEKKKKL